jgi:hypothetical protein
MSTARFAAQPGSTDMAATDVLRQNTHNELNNSFNGRDLMVQEAWCRKADILLRSRQQRQRLKPKTAKCLFGPSVFRC